MLIRWECNIKVHTVAADDAMVVAQLPSSVL